MFALFDPSLLTKVSTDTSDYGLGGVLTQLHKENVERTVTFASRALTAPERKYSAVKRKRCPVCGQLKIGGRTYGVDTSR